MSGSDPRIFPNANRPVYGSINDDHDGGESDWEYTETGATNRYENIFETEREYNATVDPEQEFYLEKLKHESKKLGQFRATAIAGNDITCLLFFCCSVL